MGRKPIYKKEKCGVCGELSYLRPVLSKDGRRRYKRWVHIKPKEGQKKSHYKRIHARKSEKERLRSRRFNNPITKERLRKKPENLFEYAELLKDSFFKLYFDFNRYYKKLIQLLDMFPLSELPNYKKLQLENKLKYSYEWEPGVEEKALEYHYKWKQEYNRFEKNMLTVLMYYVETRDDLLSSLQYPNLDEAEKKEKIKKSAEAIAILELATLLGEERLRIWNNILKYPTDDRSVGSFLDMCKIARDRFEDTIGGASKHNAALTGYYIMRLGKKQVGDEYPKSVDIIPVARKLSTKHIEEKVRRLEINPNSYIDFKYACKECGFDIDTEKINPREIDRDTLYKIDAMSNEVRRQMQDRLDSMALDVYTQAIDALEKDPLSNFVEVVYNNPITEIRRLPEDFYVEQIKNKYKKTPTQKQIDELKVDEQKEPEYMKINKIDPKTVYKFTYSMKQGISARLLHKSEYLSDHA